MFSYLMAVTGVLRAHVETRFRRDEEGSVVEKVILTAIFAALAIAIGAIIVAKVTSKAQSITLKLISRHRRTDDGSVVAEAAIVVPAAMVLILFVVQACLWAHVDALVQSAAAAGQQAAADLGGSTDSGVQHARAFLSSTGPDVVQNVSVSAGAVGQNDVEVRVRGSVESILPWFQPTVQAVRTGPIQEFRSSE